MAEKVGIAGVVLAGGASSRMGRDKALAPFDGRPLAARALARLAPQCAAVFLNVREATPAHVALGAEIVEDAPAHRGAGPLAGICAALARAQDFAFLATMPCDAPSLPHDFVARLAAAGGAAVGASSSGWEPMFALWPTSALAQVQAALARGEGSARALLQALGAAPVAFPDAVFANLNTPQDWAQAAADLLEAREPAAPGPMGVVK